MQENRNKTIKTLICSTGNNIMENLAAEARIPISKRSHLCYSDVSLQKGSKRLTSIATSVHQVFHFTSMNKQRTKNGKSIDKRFHQIVHDNDKFRAMQNSLRKKAAITNMAIKRHLLNHDAEIHNSKQCRTSNDPSFSESYFNSPVITKKDRNGYEWTYPCAVLSDRYDNLRIATKDEY